MNTKINPGEGYRLLNDNEIPDVGDDVFDESQKWGPVLCKLWGNIGEIKKFFAGVPNLAYRRKITNIYYYLNNNDVINKNDEYQCKLDSTWYNDSELAGKTVSQVEVEFPSISPFKFRRKIENQNMNTNIKAPAFILGGDFISLSFNGTPTTVYKNDARFPKVVEIIKNQKWDDLELALNTAKAIAKYSAGKVEVFDGVVMHNGKEVKNMVVNKILSFMSDGFPISPLVNFLDKLMQNPSERSVSQLYSYLEKYKLPVCEDGDFLAYKSVTKEFKDHHSGKINNSVGKVVSVPRESVDDDPNSACSFGLHVGEVTYCQTFGDGIGIVTKINPKDVVSVPHDCSSKKMRVCRYEVVAQMSKNNELTPFESDYAPANKQVENVKKIYPKASIIGANRAYAHVKNGGKVKSGKTIVDSPKPRSYFRKFKNWQVA